jgi:hypothetical protein
MLQSATRRFKNEVQALDWTRHRKRAAGRQSYLTSMRASGQAAFQTLRSRSRSVSSSLSSEEELVESTHVVQAKLVTPEQKRHHENAARAVQCMDGRIASGLVTRFRDSCLGMAIANGPLDATRIQSHDELCQNVIASCH